MTPLRRTGRLCAALITLIALAIPSTATARTANNPVTVLHTTHYTAQGGFQPMDVYVPTNPSPESSPGIVFVHGGAWIAGDNQEFAQEATAAAQRGYIGFAITYTMNTPRYPREILDVESAITTIRANAGLYHLDPNRLAGWGESAGAHLIMQAALSGHSPLRATIAWSGPYDLPAVFDNHHAELENYISGFLGCDTTTPDCQQRAAQASPINHVTQRPAPTMLVNSSDELVPLDQMTAMASALRAHHGRVRTLDITGQQHGIAYASNATQPALSFLDRTIGVHH